MVATVDTVELETKVKEMYRRVAQEPGGDYHFEGTGFSDFFETFFGSRASRGGFAARGPPGARCRETAVVFRYPDKCPV